MTPLAPRLSALILLALGSVAQASSPTGSGAAPPEPLRIELVTVGPGPAYWERFGHNAILVAYPGDVPAITYNYGIFDFAQPNFLLNFLRGRMSYRLAGFYADRDLADYVAAGRSVRIQTLALSAAEKRRLAAFLEHNRRPENASYRYDYFRANCSTKVRDALDLALGGALSRHFDGQMTEHTFREFTNRYAAPVPWLYLGTQLGLGRPTDREISRWQSFFIPEQLRLGVESVRLTDPRGRPRSLVAASRVLNASDQYPVPSSPPRWTHWFLLAGILVAAAIGFAGPRLRRWLAGGWWGGCALIGLLLLMIWLLTDHTAAGRNENLLIFSPLCLLGTLALAGRPRRRREAMAVAALILLPLLAALGLPATGLLVQHNGEFVAFAGPIHAAAASVLYRRSPA